MPIFLYAVGALVLAIGASMIGYGIPNNEFGIGNTLIVGGSTAVVGGLILVGLGMTVQQLQRLTDALATRAPIRSSRPFETFDNGTAAAAATVTRPQPAAPARVPFPPKTKPEKARAESRAPEAYSEPASRSAPPAAAVAPLPGRSDYAAPTLANPDEPPVAAADEAFLSPLPHEPADLDARAEEFKAEEFKLGDFKAEDATFDETRSDDSKADGARTDGAMTDEAPAFDRVEPDEFPDFRVDEADLGRTAEELAREEATAPTPAAPKQDTYFDAMWPEEAKAEEPKAPEPEPKPKVSEFRWANIRRTPAKTEVRPPVAVAPIPEPVIDPVPESVFEAIPDEIEEPAEPPRAAVAILKSGVVDGMGYTLYVDGSIEAELPQGTLRFASINELRSHLEKTS
jgi:hypothetical protein